MTAITANRGYLEAMNRGLPGFARFYAYVGAIIGLAAYAMFGAEGYASNGLLHFLTAQSASWIGIGAIAGLFGATALGMVKPRLAESKIATNLVSWFDGILLMVIITFVLAQFEPAQSQISYNDRFWKHHHDHERGILGIRPALHHPSLCAGLSCWPTGHD